MVRQGIGPGVYPAQTHQEAAAEAAVAEAEAVIAAAQLRLFGEAGS